MSQPIIKTPAALGLNTCKLCAKTFTGPKALQINPDNPTAHSKAAQTSLELMTHVMTAHLDVNKGIEAQGAQFVGMLRLMCFELSDPATAQQGDFIRWYVHQMTLNASVRDETLKSKSRELAQHIVALSEANHFRGQETPADIANGREILLGTVADLVESIMRMIRDALQEPEKYPGGPKALDSALVKAGF